MLALLPTAGLIDNQPLFKEKKISALLIMIFFLLKRYLKKWCQQLLLIM